MPEHTDENGEPYFDTVEEERAWRYGSDEEKITAREYEGEDEAFFGNAEDERVWRERAAAEELISVDNYTRTRYAESPDAVDERIRAFQENYGATAEERVEAYQEEAREEERETAYRIKAW